MSFTVAVKEEILGQHHLSRHELSAIIKMSGSIGLSTSGLDVYKRQDQDHRKNARFHYRGNQIIQNKFDKAHRQCSVQV